MRLWRLTRAPFVALEGAGAQRHGGRYSPPGLPVVPLASEAGLAVLIALRYLPRDQTQWPQDFVLGWTEIDARPERLSGAGEGGQFDESVRAQVSRWHGEQRSLLAAISSRVLPEADVVLLNPRHPDASRVMPLVTRPFDFADCLHLPPMLPQYRSAS